MNPTFLFQVNFSDIELLEHQVKNTETKILSRLFYYFMMSVITK